MRLFALGFLSPHDLDTLQLVDPTFSSFIENCRNSLPKHTINLLEFWTDSGPPGSGRWKHWMRAKMKDCKDDTTDQHVASKTFRAANHCSSRVDPCFDRLLDTCRLAAVERIHFPKPIGAEFTYTRD